MKKIIIIGATGIVGEATLELILQESDSSIEVVAFSNNELQVNFEKLNKCHVIPLLNFKLLRKLVLEEKPNVIINAVGISDLDYCEKNKQKAWQVNVTLVEHLVSLAKVLNAQLITFSCEHIFNGLAGPYSENDKPAPTSYLGKTKLAAENCVVSTLNNFVIIRLPLVYGVSAHGKKDFVAKVLEKCKENTDLDFLKTYYTNPVLAEDVALGVFKIIERELTGVFHFGGFDYLTLNSFVKKIIKIFNCEKSLGNLDLISPYSYFGLRQTYSEALLSMKFSSVVQGLLTYKYLDRQSSSDFESLMSY